MLYERKGHLHILRKPEPHSVDTVLGGTGTSLQIRWARITPGGFMATTLLMLTIQPFVGQPTNNNHCNQQQSFQKPQRFPTQISEPKFHHAIVVRQILKVCGSFTKKYENPASHQKPPATCETYSPQQMSQFNKTGSPHPVPLQCFLDPWQIPTLLRGFKTKCPTGRVHASCKGNQRGR